MHKFMRAIGFSKLTDRREEQRLITDIIMNATQRSYTSNSKETILAEFCEDFAQDIGIAVCGEFDAEEKFTYDYFYPYLRGTGVSSYEDVSVERHADKESYAGVCDDIKVGVSLILSAEYCPLCESAYYRYVTGNWHNFNIVRTVN